MNYKHLLAGVLAVLVGTMMLGGCQGDSSSVVDSATVTGTAPSVAPITESVEGEVFTERDKAGDFDAATAIAVELKETTIACASKGVTVKDNTMTVTEEGVYRICGKLNGQIVVNADKTAKVQLVLDGAEITNPSTAAIYVKQADKVFVTTTADSKNTLSTTGAFVAIDENNIDAALFSKEDLTINGSGSLTVTTKSGHGIVSKDDLVITGGDLAVTATSHAITGKDSVRIGGGKLTLTAGKDGIHAENTEDTTKGYIYIEAGSVTATADGDGLDASAGLQVENGTITVTTGGGSANAPQKQEEMFGHGGWNPSYETADEDTISAKGLKADGDLLIKGGTLQVDAADDALHSNSNIAVQGGTLTLSTGDDGLHADSNTAVSGGKLTITKSYEGIEGQSIDIAGGEITLTSSDDGLNASGGNDQSGFGGGMRPDAFATDSSAYVRISGGKLTMDAGGDGLDSNGNLYVTGGETYVWGPTNSGNGALDYGGEAVVTGGIVVAVGAVGMAENFGSNSTQGTMLVSLQGSAGSELTVKNADGETILSCTPAKAYNSAIISHPDLTVGETYTLSSGELSGTITMDSLICGSGSGMGGGMGGPGGGHGGMGGPGGMGGHGGGMGRPGW